MRFFANGPNIPEELLEARDNGNVVFFCGAGVSLPAGLPGFFDLARRIVDKLGAPSDARARVLLNRIDQDPDFAPPLDQVFNLLQQDYGAGNVDDAISQELKTPRKATTDFHSAILRLSRGAARRPQVVTTNFDLLFERADTTIKKHVPPLLPDLASGQPLEGLVYLHGRRALRPTGGVTRQGLTISSADFGRAYLAEGWATKFVRDLLGSYVIVLVGYSAADPPVRYLLEGLHSRNQSTSARIYTFDQGSEGEVEEHWRDRGVHALPYPKSDVHHSALWDTLRAWADRADDLDTWQRSVVASAARSPKTLQPFQRGQVASLVRTAAGAKIFADADPVPTAEWLCVFDRSVRRAAPKKDFTSGEEFDPLERYGLDDDPPRTQESGPASAAQGDDLLLSAPPDQQSVDPKRLAGFGRRWANPLPPRLFHLSRWVIKVLDQPATAWWAAGYHTLHPTLLDQIEWWFEHSRDKTHELGYRTWAILLEKFRYAPEDHDHAWYQFLPKITKEGWTKRVLREFERVVQPYVTSERPNLRRPGPPEMGWNEISLYDVVDFDVKFPPGHAEKPNPPNEHLLEVVKILRRCLEQGSALLAETNAQYFRTASFHPEEKPGERFIDDASAYVYWFVALFDRLAIESVGFARDEVRQWPTDDPFFFDKLKIYAWGKSDLLSGREAGAGLISLSDNGFWNSSHRRELLHALRARWREFSKEARIAIERRIISGPRPWDGEEEADGYSRRRAVTAATILGWLKLQKCLLSRDAREALAKLRGVDPSWRPSWDESADDAHEGRSDWVRTESNPTKILSAPLHELVNLAKQHTSESFAEFTRHEPFRGLVELRPFRALSALSYEARQSRYPTEFWRVAISHWPTNTSERLQWLFARRMARLPTEVIAELRYCAPDWLHKNLPTLGRSSLDEVLRLWDQIVDRFEAAGGEATQSGLGDRTVGGKPQNLSRRTYEHAINSPIGRMAETLFVLVEELKLQRHDGLPPPFQHRLERLFHAPGEGSDHAICEATRRLRWLHYLDPTWTRNHLIPMFDIVHAQAEPAWNGYLQDNELPVAELFALLKPHFLNLFGRISNWRWGDAPLNRLNEFLVLACLWNQRDWHYVKYSEARVALQVKDNKERDHAAWFLWRVVIEQKCWKSFGKPFLQHAWPREARFQTSASSRNFAMLAEDSGDDFPEVVRTILPLLVPVDHLDLLLHHLKSDNREEEAQLAKKFPEPMLALLDRLVPRDPRVAPYNLAQVLNTIANAEPPLREDQRWRRLDHIVNRA